MLLGVADSVVNHVPVMLSEGGIASAERGGWSRAAEFAGLILDAGWAWAATAVLAGWWVSRHARLAAGMLRGSLAGGLALGFATTSFYGAEVLFDGIVWWGVESRFWLIAGVLLGPPLGVVGAAIRLPGSAGVVAALVVPAGAALQTAVLPPPAASVMAEPVRWSVWIAAVVATVLVARRFRTRGAVASPAGAGRGRLGG
ncbi:DUF6518 family protein [Paractinoplanes hotanensis]|uniref:DUF6518 family protein n=1 Tax=Paractinoplanes hotanensis TaxID=2906497 RepID=A0ABT0YG24_9ACTN|nr:DUF6518 family protein [Actinoplanes hotanensis]MCM4085014.1 DUF6518 family protein [Actinoplanes hotanensis]